MSREIRPEAPSGCHPPSLISYGGTSLLWLTIPVGALPFDFTQGHEPVEWHITSAGVQELSKLPLSLRILKYIVDFDPVTWS